MEQFVKTYCMFCRNIKSGGYSKAIEEITGEVLDILLLKLSAQEKNIFVTCNVCSTKLFAAFHFKAACMDTEDCIFPYVHSGNGTPVDLRDVYLNKRGKEHLKDILEDERVCRLCMQVVTCEFTLVEEMDVRKLLRYIPEVNFGSTKEPIICKICFNSLDTHMNFLNNLLNVKKECEEMCDDGAMESLFSIKHEYVDIKSEENFSDTHHWNSKDEPVNCTHGYGSNHERTFNDCMHTSKSKRQQLTLKDISENETYQCQLCDYKADKKKYFARHQFKHKKRRYTCDSCDYKSIRKYNLTQHQFRHKDISEKQMYQCQLCDYKTYNKKCLTNHQVKHKEHRYTCDSCDFKTIYKQNMTRHQLIHKSIREDQMYKCDSCNYRARQKCHLTEHQLRHKDISEKQMYLCDLCDYKTDRKGCLANHQLKHKKHMYTCDSCDFRTIYKQNMTQHQLRHQSISEGKMYKCDSCDYIARQMRHLTKHQLRHKDISEKRMYQCDLCDYQSDRKECLAKHQLRHKSIPEDKMYKCDSCDYKAKHKCHLTEHLLRHKDISEKRMYQCDLCDYKTDRKRCLARHKLKHTKSTVLHNMS